MDDKSIADLRWIADKGFVVPLGMNFIEAYEANEDIYPLMSFQDVYKAKDDFVELKGKELKIFYGFDTTQEFAEERVFKCKKTVEYNNTQGLTLTLCVYKGRVFKIVLSRTYTKKDNNIRYDWIIERLSDEYHIGQPTETGKNYAKWVTKYTEILVQRKKTKMFIGSELFVVAKARGDIEKYPDYFDDQPT